MPNGGHFMNNQELFQPKWNFSRLLLCNLLALAFLCLWLWPKAHATSTLFDEWLFRLNRHCLNHGTDGVADAVSWSAAHQC